MTDTEQKNEETTAPTSLPIELSGSEIAWRLDERKAAVLGRANEAVPKAFRGKPADIMAAWLMADELGISRMAMLRGAFVVNGKPQLSGDLLLAVARAHGVAVKETCEALEDDLIEENAPNIAARCVATLPSGEQVSATFTVRDAIQAGLWANSDAWRKYPKRLLQMRARGFCLRDAIPDKLAGVYAEGELVDADYKDITNVAS